MIRRCVLLLGLLIVAIVWPEQSRAGGDIIAVVVHRANPILRLGPDDLRPIFLVKKTSWSNGQSIEPFNLPDETSTRTTFDRSVLGMAPDEIARYWIDRRIRGDARPPRKVASPGTIIALVAKTQGAIGYVPISEVNGSVKIVARVDGGKVLAP